VISTSCWKISREEVEVIKLLGKTALVTGSARGIGYGIARVLARAGANVVLADLEATETKRAADSIHAEGGTCRAVSLDVTDADSVRIAVGQAAAFFDGIHILVNNAGIFQKRLGLEVEDDDFNRCLDVNTTGVWRMVRASVPYLRKWPTASIINVASNGGRQAVDFAPAYCASKAAVVSLTQSLAMLLGKDGIRVNAVCPGRVATDLVLTIAALRAQAGEDGNPRVREPVLAGELTAEDVGYSVAFLASDLSRNITSQSLIVDRGYVIV
jgi:NAD(P)-dependent dehydrogenase (short-subunit alcohol dehydrogenase family)